MRYIQTKKAREAKWVGQVELGKAEKCVLRAEREKAWKVTDVSVGSESAASGGCSES